MALEGYGLILAVILGTLAAIVYSLRILVLLDRKIARMEAHVESLVKALLKEEDLELKMISKELEDISKIKKAVVPKKPKASKKKK